MSLPVVTVASGGLPVVDVTTTKPLLGRPVTEALNGRGVAVTKVSNGFGRAVTYAPELGVTELVIGGDFAAGTGWTLASGAAISGGVLNLNGGASPTASRSDPVQAITAGTYRAQIDLVSGSVTANIVVNIGGVTGTLIPFGSSPGRYYVDIVTTAASQLMSINGGTNAAVAVDNFSVRRVV